MIEWIDRLFESASYKAKGDWRSREGVILNTAPGAQKPMGIKTLPTPVSRDLIRSHASHKLNIPGSRYRPAAMCLDVRAILPPNLLQTNATFSRLSTCVPGRHPTLDPSVCPGGAKKGDCARVSPIRSITFYADGRCTHSTSRTGSRPAPVYFLFCDRLRSL